jgi:hypothetical protein
LRSYLRIRKTWLIIFIAISNLMKSIKINIHIRPLSNHYRIWNEKNEYHKS